MDPLGAPSPAFTNQTEYEFEDDDSSSPRDPPPLSSSQQFRREFQAFIHCSQSTAGEDAPAASSQEEPEEDEDEEQHQQQHQQHGSMQYVPSEDTACLALGRCPTRSAPPS
ncbi:unnamed protein product [Tilletia laevis]|uniref:Uncharacterized protein n=2 Tax=Tilletia TaxID=13289 RepID=A0A9N8QBW3_9BASI|nr:unnamed protein product [Tilletia controversa]CAD6900067.1 unnamed protein product [Tilletia caries]CAD6923034.1 unnamed protein product [Tilletia laevis]CAD6932746.1 unnamed protein product [Tilletia laevis]